MDSVKRVLIVDTVVFGMNGVTSVIMNYYRNMDKSNLSIDFTFIKEISNEFKRELTESGSNIYCLDRDESALKYFKKLYRIMKNGNYDVVHVHGQSSLLAFELRLAKKAKIKTRIAHSHNTACKHKILNFLLRPYFKSLYTVGLACSEAAGRWLFRNDKFIVLNNGIEIEKYNYNVEYRNDYRNKINAGDKYVIGHVGKFNKQKNHDFIIDVFNRYVELDPNALLLLISVGAEFNRIKQRVSDLNLNDKVIFLGDTTEVNKYMQAMDLFLFPSLFEGLGIVLIEAQAASLPILASANIPNQAKCTEYLQFKALEDGVESWANAILETKNANPSRIHSEVTNNSLTNAGFNIKHEANKLLDIYLNKEGI